MNTNVKPSRGRIKVSFRKKPNYIAKKGKPGGLELSWNHAKPLPSGLQIIVKMQPAPTTPGITRCMVRDHIPLLIEEGVLRRTPVTVSDWLLVECHLARKLKFSPMRLAFFVSEAAEAPGSSVRTGNHL